MVIIAKLKIISRSGIVTKRSKEISRAPGHTGQHPSPCSAVHPPALPTAGFVLGDQEGELSWAKELQFQLQILQDKRCCAPLMVTLSGLWLCCGLAGFQPMQVKAV